jgi:hypothetical protein
MLQLQRTVRLYQNAKTKETISQLPDQNLVTFNHNTAISAMR